MKDKHETLLNCQTAKLSIHEYLRTDASILTDDLFKAAHMINWTRMPRLPIGNNRGKIRPRDQLTIGLTLANDPEAETASVDHRAL